MSAEQIERLLSTSYFLSYPRVSEELLARVRNGARASEYIREEHRRLLMDQRLI